MQHLRHNLAVGIGLLAMLFAASCSFESGVSGLECDDEGATRSGEVCRDGYWRVVDDADLDAGDPTTDSDDGDGDADSTPPDSGADTDVDACSDLDRRAACEDQGMPCAEISVQDVCGGQTVTVDCSEFFDFDTDTDHCGACGQACPTAGANAEAICDLGTCTVACQAGWINANGDDTDGCETECTPTNGGVEICDDQDNDCDGHVDGADAEDAQTFYRDADGDGTGDPSQPVRACGAPQGYVPDDTDCDDTRVQVHPGADEVCDGVVDDNCDGSVDEHCPCTNGESRPCGTDVGVCQQGTQSCVDGAWETSCNGNVTPGSELCDDLDNDCDGDSDEDFAAKGDSCSVGVGACAASGTVVCTADGSGTECDAVEGSPSSEICDEIDNDCDGDVDEDFTLKGAGCTVGQGICEQSGTLVCAQDGSGTVCDATPGTAEASETCGDGLDNDCNGQVDDGCNCNYNGHSDGVCAQGMLDSSGNCQAPATYEAVETSCDGLDNDCDGDVDEYLRLSYYPDVDGDGYGDDSVSSTSQCPGTPGWVTNDNDCDDGDPWTHPGAEEICDGNDNNCNGYESDSGGDSAGDWCERYISGDNIRCGRTNAGSNSYCCEVGNDGNTYCDFETSCGNNIDEDSDGDVDCADSDCNGLSCGSGMTCQSGSCQAI